MRSRKALLLGVNVALIAAVVAAVSGRTGSGQDHHPPSSGTAFAHMSAPEIANEAADAMRRLTSMRMRGTTTDPTLGAVALDFRFDTTGSCVGQIDLTSGAAQVVVAEGEQYVRADEEFWAATVKNPADAARLTARVGDRWVRLPEVANDLTDYCNLEKLLSEATKGDNSGYRRVGTEDIGDQATIQLANDVPGESAQLWVATGRDHYLVQERLSGSVEGTVGFSDFNVPVDAQAPDGRDVFDLSHSEQPV
jgi:hypothetical protein